MHERTREQQAHLWQRRASSKEFIISDERRKGEKDEVRAFATSLDIAGKKSLVMMVVMMVMVIVGMPVVMLVMILTVAVIVIVMRVGVSVVIMRMMMTAEGVVRV